VSSFIKPSKQHYDTVHEHTHCIALVEHHINHDDDINNIMSCPPSFNPWRTGWKRQWRCNDTHTCLSPSFIIPCIIYFICHLSSVICCVMLSSHTWIHTLSSYWCQIKSAHHVGPITVCACVWASTYLQYIVKLSYRRNNNGMSNNNSLLLHADY